MPQSTPTSLGHASLRHSPLHVHCLKLTASQPCVPGIYFMRQWPGGLAFFDVWLSFQPKNVGHDQVGAGPGGMTGRRACEACVCRPWSARAVPRTCPLDRLQSSRSATQRRMSRLATCTYSPTLAQDGFNTLARGHFFRGDPAMPKAVLGPDPSARLYYAAFSNTTAISFLPASMFANAYTYVNARLWEVGTGTGSAAC